MSGMIDERGETILSARLTWSITTTAGVDNALASATRAAETGKTHYIVAIAGSFRGADPAQKELRLKDGNPVVFETMINGRAVITFPVPIALTKGNAATVDLEASGTPGVTGWVAMVGFTT
ncbi:MAG: hypothetical protein M1136_00935 [Chloroflexi bacterium]|nr:hypothetical protein [Chloroflexota bacterium]